MQCYESKAMRLALYQAVTAINPTIAYDDTLLSDLLDELAIDQPQQLFAELQSKRVNTVLGRFATQNVAIAA